MLVLQRTQGESIVIADNVVIRIVDLRGNRVRIAIEAPEEVSIRRADLCAWSVSESKSDAEE